MKSRIEHIIKAESLTNLQFAQRLDISPASVTHILSGRNNPSLDLIIRIAKKFSHYNLRWLILGEGAIYNSGSKTSSVAQPENTHNLFSAENDTNQTSLAETTKSQLPSSQEQTATKTNAESSTSSDSNLRNDNKQQTLIVCLPDGTYREYIKQ